MNTKSYSDKDYDAPGLVKLLQRAPFKWVLSEYDNPAYRPLGEPLVRIPVRLTMTDSNRTGGKRAWREECLWSNFEPQCYTRPLTEEQMVKIDVQTLLEQLTKQRDEAQAAITAITSVTQRNFATKVLRGRPPAAGRRAYTRTAAKNKAQSAKQKARWAPWRAHKKAHPDAKLSEWQKSQK
jgi:hypothetical protein